MWNSKKNRPNHQLELVEKKQQLQIIPGQLM